MTLRTPWPQSAGRLSKFHNGSCARWACAKPAAAGLVASCLSGGGSPAAATPVRHSDHGACCGCASGDLHRRLERGGGKAPSRWELGGSLEEEPATSSSPLRSINVQRTQNAIYKHAQWFLRKFDFQVARLSKPGKHLSMADPRIVAVKEYVKAEATITGLCIRSWLETSTRSGRPCTNQPGGSFGRTPGSRAPRRTSAWTLASSIVDANWRRVCRPAWGSRFQPCNPGSCVLFR